MPPGPGRPHPVVAGTVELMTVLARDIVSEEALAGEVAAVADVAEREGRFGEAEALRIIARNHRIRALESRGRLAALRVTYGSAAGT